MDLNVKSEAGESVPFVIACQRHEVSHPAAQIALTALQLNHTLFLKNYYFFLYKIIVYTQEPYPLI